MDKHRDSAEMRRFARARCSPNPESPFLKPRDRRSLNPVLAFLKTRMRLLARSVRCPSASRGRGARRPGGAGPPDWSGRAGRGPKCGKWVACAGGSGRFPGRSGQAGAFCGGTRRPACAAVARPWRAMGDVQSHGVSGTRKASGLVQRAIELGVSGTPRVLLSQLAAVWRAQKVAKICSMLSASAGIWRLARKCRKSAPTRPRSRWGCGRLARASAPKAV